MTKPRTTKTFGQLHFEDLDPHRFEDLIRELTYDYKDWQSIEATGRSGSDAGWDIRAFERSSLPAQVELDDEELTEAPHPMDGNVWMIQVKREKALGPADVKRIVSEVNTESPPYGYILAAPTNFSKKSYDVFRAELGARGVREFYVWGRAELEDMLHMPKNDRILFTFFGISLVTRRRSRTTEVRATIATKSKLYRVVGEGSELYTTVLLRDLADTHYPYAAAYPDFAEKRRWRELTVSGHHPLGIWLHAHRYYAYVDLGKREWDFTPAVDLCQGERQSEEERAAFEAKQTPVLEMWEFLPKARQGVFIVDGLVPYADIAAIDEKGDVLFGFPHIFVDFGGGAPYRQWWEELEVNGERVRLTDDFKRIKVFPKTFKAKETSATVKTTIALDEQTLNELTDYKDVGVLYAADDRYEALKAGDVVTVEGVETQLGRVLAFQITYIGRARVREYLDAARESFKHRRAIQLQVGREVSDGEVISYLEYKRHYLSLPEEKPTE